MKPLLRLTWEPEVFPENRNGCVVLWQTGVPRILNEMIGTKTWLLTADD